MPQSRDDAEKELAEVTDDATKTFLRRVLDAVESAIREGRFSDVQPVIALGLLLDWWDAAVKDSLVQSIQSAWRDAFTVTLGDGSEVLEPRADAMAFHISAVKDRLSRRARPDVPEAAFDEVRNTLSNGSLGGWSVDQMSRDIAERLAWEPDKRYWKDQKRYAEDEIDKILDPLGKPGTPARTYAHKNDPAVKQWQALRAQAVDKIREDEGDWQVRSTRIARTEATAAWNSGTLAALASEGVQYKQWVATEDTRTRESHRVADGQVVPLSRPFRVGESLLMMPGDPSAPVWEVVNCRCTVVGASSSLTAAGYDPRQIRIPAGNGLLSGRWTDSPSALVDDFDKMLVTMPPLPEGADLYRQWLRGDIENFDPRFPDKRDLSEAYDDAEGLSSRIPIDHPAEAAALEMREKIRALRDTDWSLYRDDRDIGAGDGLFDEDEIEVVRPLTIGNPPEGWTLLDEYSMQNDELDWIVRLEPDPDEPNEIAGYIVLDEDNDEIDFYASRESAIDRVDSELEEQRLRNTPPYDTPTLENTADAIRNAIESYQNNDEVYPGLRTAVRDGMHLRVQEVLDAQGNGWTVDLMGTSDSDHLIEIEMRVRDGNGAAIGSIQREVMLPENEIHNAYFKLSETTQGTGFASALTPALEEWYESNDINAIRVNANIDVGGYTWAKLGFDIDNDHGADSHGEFLQRLIPELDATGDFGLDEGGRPRNETLESLWQQTMEEKLSGYYSPTYSKETVTSAIAELSDLTGLDFSDDDGSWLDRVEYDPESVVDEILSEYRQVFTNKELAWLRDQYSTWADEAGNNELSIAMYDIATFGQSSMSREEEVTIVKNGVSEVVKILTWPGKQMLLGTSWQGVKYLNGGMW